MASLRRTNKNTSGEEAAVKVVTLRQGCHGRCRSWSILWTKGTRKNPWLNNPRFLDCGMPVARNVGVWVNDYLSLVDAQVITLCTFYHIYLTYFSGLQTVIALCTRPSHEAIYQV